MSKREPWSGGYIRRNKRGPVYVIERWVNGEHFHISTRCSTKAAAEKQLERFEADPRGYDPAGSEDEPGLVMTADLIEEFKTYSINQKKNSKEHSVSTAKYLGQWLLDFDGRDLREFRGHEIKALLNKHETAHRYRVIALKAFFRWLRVERGLIQHHEDPMPDVAVPTAKPAKLARPRAVPFAHVEAAMQFLRETPLDVLRVLAGTGLHFSELRRFTEGDGEIFDALPAQKEKGVVANLAVHHKKGGMHVVALLDPGVLEAAQRLRALKLLPSKWRLAEKVHEACGLAQVPRFTLGVMRHSVATWLTEDGYTAPEIATLLGHRSERTTQNFYIALGYTAAALPVRRPQLRVVKT